MEKKINVLKVTDATSSNVEIRMLDSAKNSPTTWDLRVYIREKMISFIQANYPENLPKTRVLLSPEEEQNKRIIPLLKLSLRGND